MKFSAALLAGFAALGLAKPAITNLSFNLTEGQPFTLTWIDAVGPVRVDLLSGPDSGSLVSIRTLGTGETDGTLTFTPTGLPSGNYAFRVTDTDGQPNFSLLFPYTGTGASSSSSGTASKTSTKSTTSAASSTSVTSDASSTSTSSTSSRSSSTRTTATTTPTTTHTNNNEGQRFSSSLALVFMTVAALVFFN